jgi:aspartate aminotransferase
MFSELERMPDDPILGLMAAFRADANPHKVDLGVGVYRDAHGATPVLECVRRAERRVIEEQTTKTYVGPAGNASLNQALERLTFGPAHPALAQGRVRTIQGVGGCGALRLGAELIFGAAPETRVYVSSPTWQNHVPLLSGCGLKLERYPYYDPASGGVQVAQMLETLHTLAPGSVVLLHASCHNPTGADLSRETWSEILEIVRRRRLLPFIDMAYQGLGQGLAEDAHGIRLFAAELPELLVAVSCSKNFGLYRERVGALHIVTESAKVAEAALSQEVRIARRLYSMPPDHGAAIVAAILADETLRGSWELELTQMRERICGLRRDLVARLRTECPTRDFGFIARQRGMFSFLGIEPAQVRRLRTEHHVYMTEDSRINIAGLRAENLDYFAHAVAEIVRADV